MTKRTYIVRDTIPCLVTYLYEVEADSEDDAHDAYIDGDHVSCGHEIGDRVRGVMLEVKLKEAQPSQSMLDAGETVLAPGSYAGGTRSQAFLTWIAMERVRLAG